MSGGDFRLRLGPFPGRRGSDAGTAEFEPVPGIEFTPHREYKVKTIWDGLGPLVLSPPVAARGSVLFFCPTVAFVSHLFWKFWQFLHLLDVQKINIRHHEYAKSTFTRVTIDFWSFPFAVILPTV